MLGHQRTPPLRRPGLRAFSGTVLFTSRGLAEYRAMFTLDDAELTGSLLDCCAGAASLVAEASARRGRAVAVDPFYAQGTAIVREAIRDSLRGGQQLIEDHEEQFVWDWYGDRATRDSMRAEAAAVFLEDLSGAPQRYVAAELPRLPFADGAFDLAVCSHLLFTWARRLDRAWHLEALRELARVAREVRVFPLVRAGDGSPTPFLTELLDELGGLGLTAEVVGVEYEFQRGGNQMIRLLPS